MLTALAPISNSIRLIKKNSQKEQSFIWFASIPLVHFPTGLRSPHDIPFPAPITGCTLFLMISLFFIFTSHSQGVQEACACCDNAITCELEHGCEHNAASSAAAAVEEAEHASTPCDSTRCNTSAGINEIAENKQMRESEVKPRDCRVRSLQRAPDRRGHAQGWWCRCGGLAAFPHLDRLVHTAGHHVRR